MFSVRYLSVIEYCVQELHFHIYPRDLVVEQSPCTQEQTLGIAIEVIQLTDNHNFLCKLTQWSAALFFWTTTCFKLLLGSLFLMGANHDVKHS